MLTIFFSPGRRRRAARGVHFCGEMEETAGKKGVRKHGRAKERIRGICKF
jgi:hypothetical protein